MKAARIVFVHSSSPRRRAASSGSGRATCRTQSIPPMIHRCYGGVTGCEQSVSDTPRLGVCTDRSGLRVTDALDTPDGSDRRARRRASELPARACASSVAAGPLLARRLAARGAGRCSRSAPSRARRSHDHLGRAAHRAVPGLRQRTGRGGRSDGRAVRGRAALHRRRRVRDRARGGHMPVVGARC